MNVKSSPVAGICDECIKTISQNIQSLLYQCYVTIHCAHLRTINLYTQISIYTYTYTIHIYICVLKNRCLCVYRVYSIHINLYILCLTSIFASLGIWFPATRGEVPSWWAKAQRASRRGCWGCSRWRWKGLIYKWIIIIYRYICDINNYTHSRISYNTLYCVYMYMYICTLFSHHEVWKAK